MTNSLSFLPQVDRVFMIDGGEILESGKYDELKAKNGPFADFIKNYQTSESNLSHLNLTYTGPKSNFLFVLAQKEPQTEAK